MSGLKYAISSHLKIQPLRIYQKITEVWSVLVKPKSSQRAGEGGTFQQRLSVKVVLIIAFKIKWEGLWGLCADIFRHIQWNDLCLTVTTFVNDGRLHYCNRRTMLSTKQVFFSHWNLHEYELANQNKPSWLRQSLSVYEAVKPPSTILFYQSTLLHRHFGWSHFFLKPLQEHPHQWMAKDRPVASCTWATVHDKESRLSSH